MVVGFTRNEGVTAKTVRNVRQGWKQNTTMYEKIFDDIDELVLKSVTAIQNNDFASLGQMMNICQGL